MKEDAHLEHRSGICFKKAMSSMTPLNHFSAVAKLLLALM